MAARTPELGGILTLALRRDGGVRPEQARLLSESQLNVIDRAVRPTRTDSCQTPHRCDSAWEREKTTWEDGVQGWVWLH